ncbi:helix-turn-helix domain-containing protein [Tardiphaga sp. 215_C5_N2_1]|uniref:helix-turn-helix domain-containing protein n=1 Tax=Tardiphaga sp. 215_C5_N2_1 TaxID=3240774 RepID=UPI003F8AE2A5
MIDAVALQFGVLPAEIVSSIRTREVLPARHAAAYLASRVSELNSILVGRQLGGRDNTLVDLYRRCAIRRMAGDIAFANSLKILQKRLSDS